jgi:glyoxylase-like metal-dependent hydrolase (beta-lactamase superfamily II)
MLTRSVKLGDFEVVSLYENKFRVDGGSMFGIIPKVLWSKAVMPDENNFITLNIHPLLVKTGKNNVLIDLGIGDALDDKMKKIYSVTESSRLTESLTEADLTPDDIDTVIFSHLHADHALGGLKLDDDGQVVKVFPNAKYYVQKTEIEDAFNPNERTAATYLADLLSQYGSMEAIDGDGRIVDGVAVIRTGGHTRGHQAIFVESGGQSLLYPGDIIPTTLHLKPPYVGAVDTFPLDSMARKKEMIENCIKNNRLVAFDHDFDVRIVRLTVKEGMVVTAPVEQ